MIRVDFDGESLNIDGDVLRYLGFFLSCCLRIGSYVGLVGDIWDVLIVNGSRCVGEVLVLYYVVYREFWLV